MTTRKPVPPDLVAFVEEKEVEQIMLTKAAANLDIKTIAASLIRAHLATKAQSERINEVMAFAYEVSNFSCAIGERLEKVAQAQENTEHALARLGKHVTGILISLEQRIDQLELWRSEAISIFEKGGDSEATKQGS